LLWARHGTLDVPNRKAAIFLVLYGFFGVLWLFLQSIVDVAFFTHNNLAFLQSIVDVAFSFHNNLATLTVAYVSRLLLLHITRLTMLVLRSPAKSAERPSAGPKLATNPRKH